MLRTGDAAVLKMGRAPQLSSETGVKPLREIRDEYRGPPRTLRRWSSVAGFLYFFLCPLRQVHLPLAVHRSNTDPMGFVFEPSTSPVSEGWQ